MKTLFYTFRTFPHKGLIPDVFVFGKLKEDLDKFKKRVLEKKPDFIIGVGNSNVSKIETKTINRFNKNKRIKKAGKEFYGLFTPKLSFPLSKKATDSFCNWTSYKLSEFVEKNNLNTKIILIHLKKDSSSEILKTLSPFF